ncbi:MAG: LD-carboxypeptidase [Bacteroidota bacterium]|nr:LD-carboxypeptidase [Bacteroidota bacterium]
MERLRLPSRLRRGATIGLTAPASPPPSVATVAKAVKYLRGKGYGVVYGDSIGASGYGYLAGDDELRASEIEAMFADPSIDAVFCVRGGYGSARLLPLIDYRLIRRRPKIFVGYSDITALSLAFWSQTRMPTFAGPMPVSDMGKPLDAESERSLWDTLCRARQEYTVFRAARSLYETIVPGVCEGRLLGGNLTIVTSLLGTPFEPDWRGCILALEDDGEHVYRIDRMLCHLRNAGVIRGARGVLLGAFTSIPPDEPNREFRDVLFEYFAPAGVPVLSAPLFGHINPKYTLPIGAWVRLDAGRGSLRVVERVLR